jgi:hypothetical protein
MPRPRKRLVSLDDTPYYHCISRCVRRAFLCGTDSVTGFDFSHRRDWIVERMQFLAEIFAIDLCAYAVMSNHYHVVVRVDRDMALTWSDREVAERWLGLFKGPALVHRWLTDDDLDAGEQQAVREWVSTWRVRLHDLSWYMRCLNESIARMANLEDRCTGRFWEGRFKSQALLDERALLACMAYVDLNPIRAAMASTPERSDYTSIQERIRQPDTPTLLTFDGDAEGQGIPFTLSDYLELVDWSGRAIRSDKRGYIPESAPPILSRLGVEHAALLDYLGKRPSPAPHAIGPVSRLRRLARSFGQEFIKGLGLGRLLCPERA